MSDDFLIPQINSIPVMLLHQLNEALIHAGTCLELLMQYLPVLSSPYEQSP